MTLRIEIPNPDDFFNPIFLEKLWHKIKRTRIVFGGSSSGKSKFLADEYILGLTEGRNCLVARKVASTLKNSVYKELKDSIERLNLAIYFKTNETDKTITSRLNEKQIVCIGLDDVEKVKGIRPLNGVWDDVWIEEATELSKNDYKQLRKRQRGRSEHRKRFTLSFNPIMKTHWIYKELFKGQDFTITAEDLEDWENIDESKRYYEDDDIVILKTIYKDNGFLDKDEINDLENENDLYFFNVYSLGNWGILGDLIFRNVTMRDLTELIPTFDNTRNGLDWGFADDPLAFVRSHYDRTRNKLYIFDELYLFGHSNKLSAEKIKSKIGHEIIYCDSAEPKSIDEYKSYTINAKGAKKGPGSVEHGIRFLQGLEIIIHSACMNIKNEFDTYQYAKDRNGNTLPKPVDINNHGIDALRYSLEKDSTGIRQSGAA